MAFEDSRILENTVWGLDFMTLYIRMHFLVFTKKIYALKDNWMTKFCHVSLYNKYPKLQPYKVCKFLATCVFIYWY